jgi:hypothetical protein
MSRYTTYYKRSKQDLRALATAWSKWAEGAQLLEDEKTGIALFFKSKAKRFGLINELKEIGVI